MNVVSSLFPNWRFLFHRKIRFTTKVIAFRIFLSKIQLNLRDQNNNQRGSVPRSLPARAIAHVAMATPTTQ